MIKHKKQVIEKQPAVSKSDADKINELTETLQRVQAEFENYKKRCDAQNHEFMKYSNAQFVEKLLPIIDTFELALKHTDSDDKEFVKGMELIYSQLISLFKHEGITKINVLGKQFDPRTHEALMQEDSDKKPGTVIEELQSGYIMHDRVLRHAKVKIVKEKKKEKEINQKNKEADTDDDKHKNT